MAVCKFCGAPVEVGEICSYCRQRAEEFYYPSYEKEKPKEAKTKKRSIPVGGYYTIVAGDTLWNLAKLAYGDPFLYSKIIKENGIENPNMIIVGDKLYIPE